VGGEPGLVGLFLLAVLGPSLAIARTSRRLEQVNRYLALIGSLLVGYTAVRLYLGLSPGHHVGVPLPLPSTLTGAVDQLPDIYLIIPDKYTSSEILAAHFGFDNSEFDRFLRDRGFVIPRQARANYPRTQLALASMLNLDYIQNLPPRGDLNVLIEHNRLAAFLKAQGYRFVFFPTPFKFTSQNRMADLQLPAPSEIESEFLAGWVRTTMLPELVGGGCLLLACRPGRFRLVPETAHLMDWKFERIAELAGGRQPTFVLAHLLLPHEPFLYRADCTHREPYWPANAGMAGDRKATEAYLDEIRCTNRKLATLVDSILARSERPPVILLQSDHGHGRLGRLPDLELVGRRRLRERLAAFTAYYLPGLDPDSVGDSITPVNTMRLVLRHYLRADLPRIEDVSYWSSEDRPLELVRVE
jgi:hypothetical protein